MAIVDTKSVFKPDVEGGDTTPIAEAIDEYLEQREVEEALKEGNRSQVNVRLKDLDLFTLDEVATRLRMSRSAAAAFLLNEAVHQARAKLIPFETSKQAEAFYQKFADSKGAELDGDFLFRELTK